MFRYFIPLMFVLVFSGVPSEALADCAWPMKTNRDSFNVAFPDTSSTYWSYRYHLVPGGEIEISGEFVAGRYFSLNTYSLTGDSIDGIADVEIVPVTNAVPMKRWRIVLRPGPAGKTGNNSLSGTLPNLARGRGVLIYRVYLPDDPGDEKAGVPLPVLTVRDGDSSQTLSPCENPGSSWLAESVIRLFGPRATEKVRRQPDFIRPKSAEGFFPNRDTKYLAALTRWQPGRLVVVRGKAPTTPDTRKGEAVTGSYQLCYWSMCTNGYRLPWPVHACVADADVVRDADGDYTMVISTEEDRPANATAANGITWLDWGRTEGTGVLILRHMLPAVTFRQAVQYVKPGESGGRVMGPYAPVSRYCDRATFESKGAKGCL